AVVDEALALIGDRVVRHHIEVDRRAATVPDITADHDLLLQVVINLFTNAIDAMKGRPGPRRLAIQIGTRERGAELVIADSGPGIPPEILGRIFDPFFTTKAPCEGTGLGL